MAEFTLKTLGGNEYEISLCVADASQHEGYSLAEISVKARFRPTLKLSGLVKRNNINELQEELYNHLMRGKYDYF